jgi:hypothetical protein
LRAADLRPARLEVREAFFCEVLRFFEAREPGLPGEFFGFDPFFDQENVGLQQFHARRFGCARFFDRTSAFLYFQELLARRFKEPRAPGDPAGSDRAKEGHVRVKDGDPAGQSADLARVRLC